MAGWTGRRVVVFLIATAAPASTGVSAQTMPAGIGVDGILGDAGEAIRGIDADICFPADAAEYAALGKNAIMMLRTSSADPSELPLQAVYAVRNGMKVPLRRVALTASRSEGATGPTIQHSFYLLPIELMRADADLKADFAGKRSGFGFMSFSAEEGLDAAAPSFVRRDARGHADVADAGVVARVLKREYPDEIR